MASAVTARSTSPSTASRAQTANLKSVLDASAVLALLQEEEGADEVESLLDGALMSTVNLSEVLQKGAQHGADVEGLPEIRVLLIR